MTAEEVKAHIEKMIESRLPTQAQATDDFNKGVKFATDYILEFINVVRPEALTLWQRYVKWLRT